MLLCVVGRYVARVVIRKPVRRSLGGADLTPEDYENYAAEHKDRAAVLKELGLPERGPEYAEAYAAAHGDGPFIPDCGNAPPGMMLPIRSMTELSLPLFAAVLKELGGPPPGPEAYAEAGLPYPGPDEESGKTWVKGEDGEYEFVHCNDSSAVASPATAVAGKEKANTAKDEGGTDAREDTRGPPDSGSSQ